MGLGLGCGVRAGARVTLAESPSVMISEHLQPFLPPASLASSSLEIPVSRCFLAPSVFLSSLLCACGGMGGGGGVVGWVEGEAWSDGWRGRGGWVGRGGRVVGG